MKKKEKRATQEALAIRRIQVPITFDSKLLKTQCRELSNLTRVTNDVIGDSLVGAAQVLEIFEWLPKGEHTITFKIV